MTSPEPQRPHLRIVHGTPTPEELAALVAVLAARGGDGEEPAPPVRSAWNTPSSLHRRVIAPGPDAWRRSAW